MVTQSYYVVAGNTYTAFDTEREAREYQAADAADGIYIAPSVRAIDHHRRGCPGNCTAKCGEVIRLA